MRWHVGLSGKTDENDKLHYKSANSGNEYAELCERNRRTINGCTRHWWK